MAFNFTKYDREEKERIGAFLFNGCKWADDDRIKHSKKLWDKHRGISTINKELANIKTHEIHNPADSSNAIN